MTISTQSFTAVNVGSSANDGTGDTLRNAFITLNNNFQYMGNVGFSAANVVASGAIVSTSPTAGIGYATGAGGTVTQLTSKSTAVILNTLSGQITANAASLSAGTEVSFTLNNSTIAATDVPVACISSGATAGGYGITVDQVRNGNCRISLTNLNSGALAEAVVINFVIIKAVAS